MDWPAIWSFFREIVAAGETFPYPPDIGPDEARELWMARPPGRVTVAVDEASGAVLGTANMAANRPGNGSHVASASYMVDPAVAGRGVGRALVEDSLGWARNAGFRGMQFNAVVESNTRAVGLYRSLGFEVVGTVPGAFRHPRLGFVGLHVMYRALGGEPEVSASGPTPGPALTVGDADPVLLDRLTEELIAHNSAATGASDRGALTVKAVDPGGQLIGGLTARTWGGLCTVDLLWVRKDSRKDGWGGRILRAAEAEALRRGCDRAAVSSFTFQAPGFYRRHGYVETGRSPGIPGGHTDVHLFKSLTGGPTAPH
ncbi:hypothetical protein GCM10010357_46930 [Streptomyces luteireticuli]|uniref:N-acetyltransferase domain-containing protein n=2 Tax=Streptomyces luteireticuli TaxID=173858 RepID=A0ABN0YY26_9ACTN